MSCAEGEDGLVYAGILPFHKDTISLKDLERPRTELMMNLGNPESAFALSMIPNDGIGLARLEFIITSYIKVHPMALVHPEKVKDPRELGEIEKLTRGYEKKGRLFCRAAFQRGRDDCSGFLPEACCGQDERFQNQRICKPCWGQLF